MRHPPSDGDNAMRAIASPPIDPNERDMVLFVPPMEPFACQLAAAVFRSTGFDARVIEENAQTLAIGLQHTGGGECVPCPSTTGALIHAMQASGCPPEKVVFFMPTACGPCRFGQYARLDSLIFERLGWGAIRILSPSAENAYGGLRAGVRLRLWHALLIADILRKMSMRIRPYELEAGETDRVIDKWFEKFQQAFAGKPKPPISRMLAAAVAEVAAIPTSQTSKPLVGVVGEIYVRCDPFLNNDLCRRIEALGGEAALAPISEWVLYTNYHRGMVLACEKMGPRVAVRRLLNYLERHLLFGHWEHHYYRIADPVLHDRREPSIAEVIAEGSKHVPWQFAGESILTLGRAALFVKRDGAQAVVNASPMFCMPGTITTSIFPKLERELNVPILCNFYDGSGDGNQSLVPVMHYLCHSSAASKVATA